MNVFDSRIGTAGLAEGCGGSEGLFATGVSTIQVNVGLRCDLACFHCHVGSSPRRTEEMSWETMQAVIEAARRIQPSTIDVTGGAPELNPNFRPFVIALRNEGFEVIVRTNLTVFFEDGLGDIPDFYREHRVHVVASLPCYLEENVTKQRGRSAYPKSIEAIKRLNALGYGSEQHLPLDLIYNPIGPVLPPSQTDLEADYKRILQQEHGIVFTRLRTITNMPIGRFLDDLKRHNQDETYAKLLRDSFNRNAVDRLMCRRQISVRWDGAIFDCDFNLALALRVDHGAPTHIGQVNTGGADLDKLSRRRITTDDHCFGCTAGFGSSCRGALIDSESGSACPGTISDGPKSKVGRSKVQGLAAPTFDL